MWRSGASNTIHSLTYLDDGLENICHFDIFDILFLFHSEGPFILFLLGGVGFKLGAELDGVGYET